MSLASFISLYSAYVVLKRSGDSDGAKILKKESYSKVLFVLLDFWTLSYWILVSVLPMYCRKRLNKVIRPFIQRKPQEYSIYRFYYKESALFPAVTTLKLSVLFTLYRMRLKKMIVQKYPKKTSRKLFFYVLALQQT